MRTGPAPQHQASPGPASLDILCSTHTANRASPDRAAGPAREPAPGQGAAPGAAAGGSEAIDPACDPRALARAVSELRLQWACHRVSWSALPASPPLLATVRQLLGRFAAAEAQQIDAALAAPDYPFEARQRELGRERLRLARLVDEMVRGCDASLAGLEARARLEELAALLERAPLTAAPDLERIRAARARRAARRASCAAAARAGAAPAAIPA